MYEVTPLISIFKNLVVVMAALITAAAAIVASRAVVKGIDAWQRERERTTRHAAAVAVLKTTYRLDQAIASIRELPFIVELTPERGAKKPSAQHVADANVWLGELDLRWRRVGKAKEAYGVAAAEAQVIWPSTSNLYDPLLSIVERLRASTLEYTRLVKSPQYDPSPEVRKRIQSDLQATDVDADDELSERIKEAVSTIEGFVRSALSSMAPHTPPA